ncbi:MAG: formylglycine-generating enzyme family protein [Luteolibacter sp.]
MNALPVQVDAAIIPRWVEIPAGSFLMGGIAQDKFVSAVELPQHLATIPNSFALGVFPVTRSAWRNVLGSLPNDLSDPDLPITCVTFYQIAEFLNALTEKSGTPVRLPSEAEWEYACRAGSPMIFPQGSSVEAGDANFLYDEAGQSVGPGMPTPLGRFSANAFGLHDMLGNVCEWTADTWHPDFHNAPNDGSPWLIDGKPECRVIRGGAWDQLPRVLRASWRDWAPENACWDNLGFRIAFTL